MTRIILLNGVSSAGKTSIARELVDLLDPPHFLMAVDAFGRMRSAAATDRLRPEEVGEVLRKTRAGFHRAVAGMAAAGDDVVVDYVLSEAWRLQDLLDLWREFDVVLVGVHCALVEIERRERARGDRQPGQGASQLALVHAHGLYDIEVDTTTTSARDCALQIRQFLDRPRTTSAFTQLRQAPRIRLLADLPHLVEAAGLLRHREWGRPPEPAEPRFWIEVTGREAGRDELPITWVAVDDRGEVIGVVGLGEYDLEEIRDRTPWVMGMVVRRDRRGAGVGRRLLDTLSATAEEGGHTEIWVATDGPAIGFYERCGYERVERRGGATVLRRSLRPWAGGAASAPGRSAPPARPRRSA
jgi:chloramphenicol 3-O phosphotransferase